ncbi:hypothetical protein [Psychrobacillus sp. MER TA 171]|uniref:hypothetical protein n=1 Tax=Psychrobacillus sp. MER TA 171 TaxID=2939577 RepID=UPI0020420A2D|nr:hypothetical protein [Psychrobacillus sp. MER TA 171]MCM3358032.1 hypothetical protein [Psychrobacillus sp. MER TA 171]
MPQFGTNGTSTWYATLGNSETSGKHYLVGAGTSTQFSTYGPAEQRRMIVYDPNWNIISTVKGNEGGIVMVTKARVTGEHRFYLQNMSASSNFYRCEVKF